MMISQSLLFGKSMLSGQAILSDVLQAHKNSTIQKIKKVANLSDLTDQFLSALVHDSLVTPVVIHFDKMTKKIRTEKIDGAYFPFDYSVERGRSYPKDVARISIPFSGDANLLRVNSGGMPLNHPQGEVNGNAIQYDIILWGDSDQVNRVKEQVESHRKLLDTFASASSSQVKAFNESLPAQIKAAFEAKIEDLTKKRAVFDDLGIPDEPEHALVSKAAVPSSMPAPKRDRSTRAVQIIQYVENMYVQELNQTNSNLGDVNNAIQSNE